MDTHFVPLKCITTVKRKAPETVSVTKKKTTKGSVTITDFFSKPHRRDSSHDTSDGNVGTTDTQCTSSAHHPDTEEIPTSDASACSSPSHSPAPVQEQCSKCTAVCCLPNARPHQPTSEAALKATSMQVGNKREHRSFQKKWYRDHPWITLCSTNNKAYCHTCRAMAGTLSLSKHTEPAFTGDGFCSWKRATQRFRQHENSAGHKQASFQLARAAAPAIDSQLSDQHARAQAARRGTFLKQLSTIRLLLRQGLAIRGHTECESNFHQLLTLRCEDDNGLRTWLQQNKYMSPEIVNECILLMSNCVVRNILNKIHDAKFFAILADETSDVQNKEQLAICIRWVDDQLDIHEDFIGLVHVEQTDAKSLYLAIKDVLIRCSLPLSHCRGQGYDGAANMMGHLRGLAKRVEADEASAIPVHCFAHCLNLCLQEAARRCSIIRDSLGLVNDISKLIRNSPKRALVFSRMQRQLSPEAPGLKPLCPTRWTVRTGAIHSVLENYEALVAAFDEMQSCTHDDQGHRAAGVFCKLEEFRTYIGLKLSYLVFGATEEVSHLLQSKTTTVDEAVQQLDVAKRFLQRQRSDEAFRLFYDQVVSHSTPLTHPPMLPRRRRLPARYGNCSGTDTTCHATAEDAYRKEYYEVIDVIIGELDKRFEQRTLTIPRRTEKLLLSAANWTVEGDLPIDDDVLTFYKNDINGEQFRRQLRMVPDMMKCAEEAKGLKVVTTIRTLADIITSSSIYIGMFSEVVKLLRIFMTVPVSTASAERSFSSLRRLKTYLRSTMTQQRLNNVMVPHCHKHEIDNIDLTSVAKEFVSANESRTTFFGNY